MKFFVDTADVAEIKDFAASGLLDGVTPPSVLRGLFKNVLTDAGLKAFLDDWAKTGLSIL
jgi:transaldolase